jgi:asparagine synthase (glutamine-hydrolysing)
MCGIFAIVNPRIDIATAHNMFLTGEARGPDNSSMNYETSAFWVGFHRLAINGLNDLSNQPLRLGSLLLVCNGEIYNSRELYERMGVNPSTQSDCEVILHLFVRYGIEETVRLIDASEFAFILHDVSKNETFVVRDPYGVRPLYRGNSPGKMVLFGSELKMLQLPLMTYRHVQPGSIEHYDGTVWTTTVYHATPVAYAPCPNPHGAVRAALTEAVMKRVKNTERPMACLLSGGLDSSIVAALVVQSRLALGMDEPLETYSIGLEGGEDLRYASIMAAHLQTRHTTIILDEDGMFREIQRVIYNIESYDTTTVRASVPNFLVAEYIAKNSDAKVVFNGDGSDELAGGYLYFKHAPDAFSADAECHRLLRDIHCFDALRSDKSISSHGLEPRTPFLDRAFVQTYLSVPIEDRFPPGKMEKHFLRQCFADLLPPEIAWRTKEAFSDGVSAAHNSWFEIIGRKIDPAIIREFNNNSKQHGHNPPRTPEQYFYRSIFDQYYSDPTTVPYFWMPRFVNALDCSARTLNFTTDTIKQN